jgi:hypothetical protein
LVAWGPACRGGSGVGVFRDGHLGRDVVVGRARVSGVRQDRRGFVARGSRRRGGQNLDRHRRRSSRRARRARSPFVTSESPRVVGVIRVGCLPGSNDVGANQTDAPRGDCTASQLVFSSTIGSGRRESDPRSQLGRPRGHRRRPRCDLHICWWRNRTARDRLSAAIPRSPVFAVAIGT